MPKFITVILSFCLIIGFFRIANDYGDFRLVPLVDSFASFDVNLDDVFYNFDETKEIFTEQVWWDDALTGVSGFFINIKNVIVSFFSSVILSMVNAVNQSFRSIKAVWNVIVNLVSFVRSLVFY